jgi:hypothetical protein
MNEISKLAIEINDESVAAYILSRCARYNITAEQYVVICAKRDYESEQQMAANDIERLVLTLEQDYQEGYKKRFGVSASNENGDGRKAIFEVVYVMVQEIKSVPKTETILKRAITWYLNFHDNSDTNGGHYPYGLKYLFSKKSPWLLRTCIESSMKLDDKMFKLMNEGKLTRDEAIRTLKRGDAAGSGKQKSAAALLDEALRLYSDIKEKYGAHLNAQFKFHPIIDDLFKSEIPSEDYIQNSIMWLMNFRSMLEEKYKNEA